MYPHAALITAVLSLCLSSFTQASSVSSSLPDFIICEDTLDGSPPFNPNNVPCLLGCGAPEPVATASLLPGSVNDTDVPYCRLDCVRGAASPEQSAAAPDCNRRCEERNGATPENVGWCMYWCVDGYAELVEKTACVPSLEFGSLVTTTAGGVVVTVRPFNKPPEWQSWYQTQTVLPKSGSNELGITSTYGPTATDMVFSSSSSWDPTAPFRVSPAPQVTQTSESTVSTESVVGTETGEETTASSTVATPSTTGAAGHFNYKGLIQMLLAFSILITMILI